MTLYVLHTHWVIDAPLKAVWEVAYDIEHWPSWWKYVDAVIRLEPGERTGVGAVYRCVWTTRLPYTLTFDIRATRVRPHRLIEGAASGEIEGISRCIFRNLEFGTSIHHEWRVRTTKPWMNRLAAPLKPVFIWNHHAVMKAGGNSLAKRLGATLLRFETREPSMDFQSQAETRSGSR